MRLRPGMCGLGLLAAIAVQADDPSAPLENSKQELKALRKDQAAQGGEAAVGKLRDAMPQMQTPAAGSLPVELPMPQNSESELKRQKEAQKNWLLDGMDQLDKSARRKSRNTKDNQPETDDELADQNEPGSLLKIYTGQQKTSEAKADAKKSTATRVDPLAPFLQDWLADSPVRGKFFDEYFRKPDAGAGGIGATTLVPRENIAAPALFGLDTGGFGLRDGPGGATTVQANPYLQGLDMPAGQDPGSRHRQSGTIAVFHQDVTQAPSILVNTGEVARQPEKKRQLPAGSDDKKYFPQLKKF